MKLADITPAPWNTRNEITEASIRQLAESIKADGLIQPISVCDNPDGDGYICYDGNRRLAACKSLGWKDIAANYTDVTLEDAKIRTVTANLQREDDDPLLAANVIAGLGGDPEIIASKLGKTVSWVRRRGKLNALTDEIKAFVGKVTLEVLERVSDLSANDQKKLAKQLENRVKWANGNQVKWNEVKRDVDAMTADLDEASFDTAECAGCSERTGADWFADEGEGKLGRCVNCKCFNGKLTAWEDSAIAAAIPADAEKVRVNYEWQTPWEIRKDTRDRRDKQHPCAWYWFDGGKLTVKWAKSQKQIDAAKEAEEKKREAERAASAADRERNERVSDAIYGWTQTEDFAVDADKLVRRAVTKDGASLRDRLAALFVDWCGGYLNDEERCEVVALFNATAETIGGEITDDDLKWFVDRHATDGEDEAEGDEESCV